MAFTPLNALTARRRRLLKDGSLQVVLESDAPATPARGSGSTETGRGSPALKALIDVVKTVMGTGAKNFA